MEGIRLLRKGLRQSEVARQLHVSHRSVGRWAKGYAEQGRRSLRRAGRAGRKPRLSGEDLKRLERGLLQGPAALGYETPLWTSGRVADLIEREFGVRYHPGHVWRILVRLGWSCQRPEGRARERNEEAIRHWKKVRWPIIKKSPCGGAHDPLPRRERTEPAAASGADLGAQGTDAGAGVQLQLEGAIGHRRDDVLELLFPSCSPRPSAVPR
jgi:transposase